MKKTILLTIVLVILSSQAFAGVLIDDTSDIIPKKIVCDNGQKLKYYETRVLISPLREVKKEVVKKVEEPICNCKCDNDEDDIIVTYTWAY